MNLGRLLMTWICREIFDDNLDDNNDDHNYSNKSKTEKQFFLKYVGGLD
jgi:hypothetical protein